MSNNDLGFLGFTMFVVLGVLIAAIFAAFYLVKKSNDQVKKAEMNINMLMGRVPQDKQMLFMMQYNNSKKNPTTAVLLALFLGGLGIHKFYMGQTFLGILYLLFSWTGIPSIVGFIEAFTIAGAVGKHNEQKATEIASMMGALS